MNEILLLTVIVKVLVHSVQVATTGDRHCIDGTYVDAMAHNFHHFVERGEKWRLGHHCVSTRDLNATRDIM